MSNWVPSERTQVARVQLIEQKVLSDGGPLVGLAARIGEDDKWIAATRERFRASALPLRLDDFLTTATSEPGVIFGLARWTAVTPASSR